MKIGDKFAIVAFALYGLYATADGLIQRLVLLPAFESLERQAANAAMDLVLDNIDRDLQQIVFLSSIWSKTAEISGKAENPASAISQSNLSNLNLRLAGIDFVAVLDRRSRRIGATTSKGGSSLDRSSILFQGGALPPGHPLRLPLERGLPAKGLVVTKEGPALIVLEPIPDPDREVISGGSVLLGRFLTDDVVTSIGNRSKVPLKMVSLPEDPKPQQGVVPVVGTSIDSQQDSLEVSHLMKDIHGRPAVSLEFSSPRMISEQARHALRFALFSLLLSGSFLVLAILVALNWLVVKPVQTIETFVQNIAQNDDLSARLAIRSRDEFGQLAGQFNIMVDRLAKARRDVVDKSFEAGLAETARGVLHNIGNALTPVIVGAGTLQSNARNIPVKDMEMVASELDRPNLTPSRRSDLQKFLHLSISSLASRSKDILNSAQELNHGLQAIQSILHQQLRFARSSHIIERVALRDLVRQAKRLVSPDMLSLIQIQMDPSIDALGPQPLPRVAMEQVIQNILLNACEAVQPGSRGMMRISGTMEGDGGRKYLHLVFADNGVGIPKDVLPQLFSKGFSTKSATTNSGLGLHWCANVVNALDGSLDVDSPGEGKGANFHLRFPISSGKPKQEAVAGQGPKDNLEARTKQEVLS